ncbi:Sorbicillinoid biosynthetic cluster transcription factor 2 [Paramyrothecium foliicola]|nr:Sorbicillinoid biosynthetic cluster transcription factor 2 [Paramyrothecium foliicola]
MCESAESARMTCITGVVSILYNTLQDGTLSALTSNHVVDQEVLQDGESGINQFEPSNRDERLQGHSTPLRSSQEFLGFEQSYESSMPLQGSTTSLKPELVPDHADAMTGTTEDPLASKEFFGRSSASSFVRQVSSVIESPTANNDHDVLPEQFSRTENAQSSEPIDHRDYLLPPRRYADSLLNAYYDLVWAVFPILDRTVLQKCYEGCWQGSSCSIPEHILYCMMNLVFALGSQFAQAVEPSQRKETGLTFGNRARKLYHYHAQGASLERFQCLLLMGLYLQSTSKTHECWMTVGSAIRMAQSLGLHSQTQSTRPSDRRRIQIARRVWHGCVYQDRVLSMTFGRPSMIAKWLQTPDGLPAMIDDEFLDTQTEPSAIRPDGGATVMAFFRKSLELYEIINDILIQLYLDPKEFRSKNFHHLGIVLSLDQRLVEWSESLPDHLKYSFAVPNETLVFRRQRVVLRARYLQARMVLFRPILADLYLKPQTATDNVLNKESSLSHHVIVQCARLCFEAAREMLDVLYDNFDFDTVTGPVPAWWFSVLYVYTAATVLLSERLRSICGPSEVSKSWADSWDRAIRLLGAYTLVGESAKRCMNALGLLSAKVHHASGVPQHQEDIVRDQMEKGGTSSALPATQDSEWLGSIEDAEFLPHLVHMDFDVDDSSWLVAPAADMIF